MVFFWDAGTLIHCICVPSSSFAWNDDFVAVEDFIDVGNVLYIRVVKMTGLPQIKIQINGNHSIFHFITYMKTIGT